MPSSLIPAGLGAHAKLQQGQRLKIISTFGAQIVDLWAFAADSPSIYLSMSHTRAALAKLTPGVGDVLVGSTRWPMLALVEDSTNGNHDTLLPACDKHRYFQFGITGFHNSCSANLHREASTVGVEIRDDWTPDQLSLFRNVMVDNHEHRGTLNFGPTSDTKGQYVVFEARCHCVVILSACPMDLVPGNGDVPTSCEFEVID